MTTKTNSRAPYDTNTATLPETTQGTYGMEYPNNAKNLGGDKETIETTRLIVFSAKERKRKYAEAKLNDWSPNPHDGFETAVDVRFYMGRSNSASTVYCSVWIRTADGDFISGHGSAGGYGYHKTSAAFQDAIDSAGIKLEASVHGCGDRPMKRAMLAIARACGYNLREDARRGSLPYTFV